VLPLSSVAQAARGISKTVAVGVLRGSAMVIIVANKDGREHTNTSRKVRRRAAHTDIMQISEQVFDEPLAWRHSGQQGQRVRIRSDGSSLLDLPRS
jgi:hypothetical protein